MLAAWPVVPPFDQVAVAHVEDQPSTRPLRWMHLAADAGCRMPAADHFAIRERGDETFPRRNRRVPRVLHGERNEWFLGRRRGTWPPKGNHPNNWPQGERLRSVQGPMKIAPHPGDAAKFKEVGRLLFGDRRALALHRLDLNHPRKEHRVQRLI